jgi:hypothetical protein
VAPQRSSPSRIRRLRPPTLRDGRAHGWPRLRLHPLWNPSLMLLPANQPSHRPGLQSSRRPGTIAGGRAGSQQPLLRRRLLPSHEPASLQGHQLPVLPDNQPSDRSALLQTRRRAFLQGNQLPLPPDRLTALRRVLQSDGQRPLQTDGRLTQQRDPRICRLARARSRLGERPSGSQWRHRTHPCW